MLMKNIFAIFFIILVGISCSKEQSGDVSDASTLTIQAGFEDKASVDTKT